MGLPFDRPGVGDGAFTAAVAGSDHVIVSPWLTTMVTLTAEPVAEGRPFVGWQLDGVMLPVAHVSDTRLTVTIESARAVRAVYSTSGVLEKPPGLLPAPSARGVLSRSVNPR